MNMPFDDDDYEWEYVDEEEPIEAEYVPIMKPSRNTPTSPAQVDIGLGVKLDRNVVLGVIKVIDVATVVVVVYLIGVVVYHIIAK